MLYFLQSSNKKGSWTFIWIYSDILGWDQKFVWFGNNKHDFCLDEILFNGNWLKLKKYKLKNKKVTGTGERKKEEKTPLIETTMSWLQRLRAAHALRSDKLTLLITWLVFLSNNLCKPYPFLIDNPRASSLSTTHIW